LFAGKSDKIIKTPAIGFRSRYFMKTGIKKGTYCKEMQNAEIYHSFRTKIAVNRVMKNANTSSFAPLIKYLLPSSPDCSQNWHRLLCPIEK